MIFITLPTLHKVIRINLYIFCFGFFHGTAMSANGTNIIGYGHESLGIAGADIGFIRDTSAVAVNPSGLSQIESNRIDLHTGFSDASDIRHQDIFGNDDNQTNSPIPFAGGAFAYRINNKLVVGSGLLAQGGAGIEYKKLNTAFGTRDNLKNLFSVAKLSTGLGYQATPELSVGISLDLFYASLKQEVFPGTSVPNLITPSQSFFGYSIDNARTLAAGLRVGLQYRLTDRLLLGAAYATPSKLDIEDAEIRFNYSGLGLGRVKYDADIKGLKQPEELGIGLSFQLTDDLTITTELNWINWSSALDSTTLTATRPDNPLAPANVTIRSESNWNDQYVISAGLVYEPGSRLTLRAGFNYGKNPIPDDSLSPLLPMIGEKHIGLGVGYNITRLWQINGTLVRDLPNKATYTNNATPFGPNAKEKYSITLLLLTISRTWE